MSTGCASQETVATVQEIEVEGTVTVRGNEPFTAVILETPEGNWYKLELTTEQRSGMVNPSVQRVRGTVSLGDWNGRPFAVLTVGSLSRVMR
ncbi:MAG: hypothetical protein JJ896_05815 [Rhodothermales bacterium]|nr:hypothetical protein [Rhodothermales bacterium]MBO6779148.1 hypothetical protein [Rhodothermales bacterium]